MSHWAMIGYNDFLIGANLARLREDLKPSLVTESSRPEDIYILIRAATADRMLIVYDWDAKHKRADTLQNMDIGTHHLIWHVKSKAEAEGLGLGIPPTRYLACEDMSEARFPTFIRSVLKEHGTELISLLAERLDRGDLYEAWHELVKFSKFHKDTASKDITVVGVAKKSTVFDLFNAFLRRQSVTLEVLNNLAENGTHPLQIFGFMTEAVRRIILLRVFKSKGVAVNDCAATIGLNPYFANRLEKDSSGIDTNRVFEWYSRLCDLDIAMKYSGLDGWLVLKTFFLEGLADVHCKN
jgi:hypothetical protein